VYVHAIWEGSGNVIALDVLRAIEHGALPGYLGDQERRAEAASSNPATAPLASVLLQQLGAIERAVGALPDDPQQRQLPLRRLARRMAQVAIGARLAEQGAAFLDDAGSGRLAWIAARYLARLGGEPVVAQLADDPSWLPHADALLHGGDVPAEVAHRAATTLQRALRDAGVSEPASLAR